MNIITRAIAARKGRRDAAIDRLIEALTNATLLRVEERLYPLRTVQIPDERDTVETKSPFDHPRNTEVAEIEPSDPMFMMLPNVNDLWHWRPDLDKPANTVVRVLRTWYNGEEWWVLSDPIHDSGKPTTNELAHFLRSAVLVQANDDESDLD